MTDMNKHQLQAPDLVQSQTQLQVLTGALN